MEATERAVQIPVFAVRTTVSLTGPPGRRQGLRAGQWLGEGLPLMGGAPDELCLTGPEMLTQSLRCWINVKYFHKC